MHLSYCTKDQKARCVRYSTAFNGLALTVSQMELTQNNKKRGVKSTSGSENSGFTTKEQTIKKRSRRTVIKKNAKAKTTMGAGYSQVYDPLDSPRPEENASSKCQVCFSSLKCSYKTGQTDASLQCTQCAQFLCGSCLYPCTSDSATCTNKLCPLVSTLLTCGVVSNPKSKVFGCPEFRACPKCHSLIMHESGCKFVRCKSGNCNHGFCFICLQDDCRNDQEKYWSLTCKKPRAERQQFMLT